MFVVCVVFLLLAFKTTVISDTIKDPCGANRTPRPRPRCDCSEGCSEEEAAYAKPHMHLVNVALNQRVAYSQPPDSPPLITQSLACQANNGHTGTSLCLSEDKANGRCPVVNCIRTHAEDMQPWWKVTLDRPYSVSYVQIHGENGSWANMAGVEVYVDAEKCFSFAPYTATLQQLRNLYAPSNDASSRVYNATCSDPIKGRVVALRKTRFTGTLENHQLVFCEVQIWVCDHGYSGDPSKGRPCQPCSDVTRCRYPCDNVHGCYSATYWNVALHKTPDIRKLSSCGPASLVLDGLTTSVGQGTCVESRVGFNYFIVHLNEACIVKSVTITARSDCCYSIMNAFKVYVTQDIRYQEGPPGALCYSFKGDFLGQSRNSTRSFTCRSPLQGRFVAVFNSGYRSILLCELQVWGIPVNYDLRTGDVCYPRCFVSQCNLHYGPCLDLTCRLYVGKSCSGGKEALCEGGRPCDRGVCRHRALENCNPRHADYCPLLTSCVASAGSSSYICASTLGGNCTAHGDCTDSLLCDQLKKCKKGLGKACENSEQCMAGAICSSGQCQCHNPACGMQNDDATSLCGQGEWVWSCLGVLGVFWFGVF